MKIRGYDHITINAIDMKKSVAFYDKLFSYLGLRKVHDEPKLAGWVSGITSFWLHPVARSRIKNKYSRVNPGPNHIAFRARSKADVNKLYTECLKPNKFKVLYSGPGEQIYAKGYYAVYFEDPDSIKLEVMWLPDNPKHEH